MHHAFRDTATLGTLTQPEPAITLIPAEVNECYRDLSPAIAIRKCEWRPRYDV